MKALAVGLLGGFGFCALCLVVYSLGFIRAQIDMHDRVWGPWLARMKQSVHIDDHETWMRVGREWDRAFADFQTLDDPLSKLIDRLAASRRSLRVDDRPKQEKKRDA